jgi:hypothetical protein
MEAGCFGEGLSESLPRVIDDAEDVDWLREILSGFSHRCRDSLNGMKLGLYLCKRESPGPPPAVWRDLEQTCERIERTIDRLQLIYRPMRLTLVESELGSMIAEHEGAWRASFAVRGKELVLDPPASERPGQFDPTYLGQGLDALVSWRAEATPVRTRATLSWQCRDDRFRIEWSEGEAGPRDGVAAAESSRPDDPRTPLRRRVDSLSLPLLARIIRAHGGTLFHPPGSNRWLRMNWPRVLGESCNC